MRHSLRVLMLSVARAGRLEGEHHVALVKYKLSIVIPAYNEERTVAKVLDAVFRVELDSVLGLKFEREVIVLDDGSTDRTRDILATYDSSLNLRVLLHDCNRGKGAALRTGFAAATGDIVLIQDADGEYDPGEYARLLEPIVRGHADVVYGYPTALSAARIGAH
jgi:glycosyltransferase involved in cell wall biosynthesis